MSSFYLCCNIHRCDTKFRNPRRLRVSRKDNLLNRKVQMQSPQRRNLETVLLFLVCVALQTHGVRGMQARRRQPDDMAVCIQPIGAMNCVAGCATGLDAAVSGLVHGVSYRLLLLVRGEDTEIHSNETSITWMDAQGSAHLFQRMLPPLSKGTYSLRVSILDAAASTKVEALLASVEQRLVCKENLTASDCSAPEFGWTSHCRQDKIIADVFGNKTGGWFVDLAANHAWIWSNTFVLERDFNWTGVCIEPNPEYWEAYSSLRSCQLVKQVVGKLDGEQISFAMHGRMGGIMGDDFDNKAPRGDRETTRVKTHTTVSLASMLAKTGAPSIVDYLSLDIEGAEAYVMESFPFDKYTFLAITVERPRRLRRVLESKGYVYISDTDCEYGDELYLHKSIPNFGALLHRLYTPKPIYITEVGGWDDAREEMGRHQVTHPAGTRVYLSHYALVYEHHRGGSGVRMGSGARLKISIVGTAMDVVYVCDVFMLDKDNRRIFERNLVVWGGSSRALEAEEDWLRGNAWVDILVGWVVVEAEEEGQQCDLIAKLYDGKSGALLASRVWYDIGGPELEDTEQLQLVTAGSLRLEGGPELADTEMDDVGAEEEEERKRAEEAERKTNAEAEARSKAEEEDGQSSTDKLTKWRKQKQRQQSVFIDLGYEGVNAYNLVNPMGREQSGYWSQYGQDQIVDKLLGRRPELFFIDSGGYNGEDHSNTLFLEKVRNWKGMIIEPNPHLYAQIRKKKRKCMTVNAAISPHNKDEVLPFVLAGPLGGLSACLSQKHQTRLEREISQGEEWMKGDEGSGKTIMVPSFPLEKLLKAANRSNLVADYWSLDTEGSEPQILKATNFTQITVGVLSIEHNGEPEKQRGIREAMAMSGLILYQDVIFDYIYLNPTYFHDRGLNYKRTIR